jgi:hypothetical protein
MRLIMNGPHIVIMRSFFAIILALLVNASWTMAAECDTLNDHPEWLWCDDFELEHDISVNYPDYSTTGFSVTADDPFEGNYSLRQHYDQGMVNAGWIAWFYCDTLGNDYGPCHDDIYVRWYHKFEPGFEGLPPKMARINSIGPGWDKRFGVHHWIEGGVIVADVEAPYSSQANDAGWLPTQYSSFDFNDHIGDWVCLEMRVKKNTPGQADGAYIFWANDVAIINRTSVDLVGSTSYNFNNVMLDTYWNGGSPKAQSRYYDNFVISTQRIGCLSTNQSQTYNPADIDRDGCVNGTELLDYRDRWNLGLAATPMLLETIGLWKLGC